MIYPAAFRPVSTMQLSSTPAARSAHVTAGALVIAGAGSGKTRTLTYRVAWLLEQGVSAGSILLLTFTNKAAREMLDRVASLLPQGAAGIWGGTFHSIGNRILRRHAQRLGFRQGFTIMDREDQNELIEAFLPKRDREPLTVVSRSRRCWPIFSAIA